MKCPKCQHDNRETAKFCDECACPLQATDQRPSIDFTRPHSYTPKFLADKILTTRSAMEGERKRVTVLFADVAGFTSMSEKIDPEEVHQVMDGCFKILMDEIHNHQGTINQFTGDGVMALFGAPVAIENHAQNACQAALSIQSSMKKYSEELKNKSGIDFKMRIGINTGPVIVGSIGDDLRMDYTAIGDTTNLAARMESMAEPGSILVSPLTYKQGSQFFKFESLGKVTVKGKEEALDVYELVGQIDKSGAGLNRQIFSEMVGRDNDLNRLELQVNKTINGEGSVVNIIGEAGIGKSRLIAELKRRDVIKRVVLLEGRAISIGRNLSFYPIIDLLKHWAKISEDDNEAASLVKLETAIQSVSQKDADEIIPLVATLMGMKLSGRYAERIKDIEGEPLEKLILKNVRDLLTNATELTPLVVIVEDLHWADTSSIELLESLFRLAERQRILFINVLRPDHKETGERIVKSLQEKLSVYYVEINLEPLTEQISEILIDNMLNIKGLHHGIKNQIVQRAGGNPFFIEEVVRSFIDEGAVVVKNGNFEVTDKIEAMVIPHTINDVLMARIDRLEEETRDLVKVASVIGRNFFHRILSEVAKSVNDMDSRLSHLKNIQLIRERKRMEELEYLFKHALAQEAAYESILHQKRKEIHLQVAHSIEKVFDERLHEFYGMLALHYIKGEDNEKAEYYLVKAGEEALRSSASSEALNYYQEGLKLYLLSQKAAADPEKLAMFEKNIALALYSKSQWVEAVEHFEEVFKLWDIPTSKNRLFILIEFAKNVFTIISGLNDLIRKRVISPSQKDKAVIDLFYKNCSALAYIDNFKFLFTLLSNFNRISKFDMAKSPEVINIFMATANTISVCGLFPFKLSYQLLKKSITAADKKSIQNLITYFFNYTMMNLHSGYWEKNRIFEIEIVDKALNNGELWNVANYIWFFVLAKTEIGDFRTTEFVIAKLSDIASSYDYNHAAVFYSGLRTDLMLKKGQLSEALDEVGRGYDFSRKYSTEMFELIFLSFRAQAYILSNNEDKAKDAIRLAEDIVNKHKFFLSVFIAPYLVAQFMIDIHILKESIGSKSKSNKANQQKKAHRSGLIALRRLRKYALYRTKVLRLMGEYYWLIGKQKKALKWWDRSIKKGEELGARPDLSRAYFQIGKSLLEPDSKFKKLNGITAEEYLEKARTMFEDMDLQWDLDELHKVMAAR